MNRNVSTLVIGGGLAGTTLTWHLLDAGDDVVLVDRGEEKTSSKVAAGLISPVTGKRLARMEDFDLWWDSAKSFYRKIETRTGTSLLTESALLRLFRDEAERERVQSRVAKGWDVEWKNEVAPYLAPHGAVEIPVAGRLNVKRYLASSHQQFGAQLRLLEGEIHPLYDVKLAPEGVLVQKLGIMAKRVVFCQGYLGAFNPYFSRMLFNPAKGQILTVRIPGFKEDRIIQHEGWLVRVEDGLYKVGATYEHQCLDGSITLEAKEEVLTKVRNMLGRDDVEVVDHEAGVRPVLLQQWARIGTHPVEPRLGYFNGLGSKGSLQGPRLAQMLTRHLLDEEMIEKRYDVRAYAAYREMAGGELEIANLTHVAQEFVKVVLKESEWAIDATAGNGYDTVFLAGLVGKKGRIVAIDQQDEAVESTRRRVEQAGLDNVEVVNGCHSHLSAMIPEEGHGSVGAVMFNLGYLPGGNKKVITKGETTERAIRSALSLLRPGGILTVLAYVGHEGGLQEEAIVREIWNQLLPTEFTIHLGYANPPSEKSPRLFVARRRL